MPQTAGMEDPRSLADPAGRALAEALRDRLANETSAPVTLLETHISWVLLAGRLAYKLKKPVCLGFVDFSTLAARKHFCDEELRLNRRLAPSLYLDVLPVCGTRQAPRIGTAGEGGAIDHVVRMRRFPEGMLLRDLVMSGRLEPGALDRFASRLAGFHAAAPRAALSDGFGSREAVVRPVLDTLERLREAGCGERIAPLAAWVRAQADVLATAWFARQRGGAVRECHGDLHLSNVVWLDGELTAFDCIEFDEALRWIDVMNELAFLFMDLQAHGRRELAFRFLDHALQASGDYEGLAVLRFYAVYRALVRALVGRLRSRGGAGEPEAAEPDYLACAEGLAHPPAGLPRLMITHGLSGSGKSTVAGALVEAAGAVRIRSDVERKRLFGLRALESSGQRRAEVYSADATLRTFERLAACARAALLAGYPVIVDAAFLRREERRAFAALAAEMRVPFSILHCRAAPARLRARVVARGAQGADASEADLAVLERQLAGHEPLAPAEQPHVLEAFTDEAVDAASLASRWMAAALDPRAGA